MTDVAGTTLITLYLKEILETQNHILNQLEQLETTQPTPAQQDLINATKKGPTP